MFFPLTLAKKIYYILQEFKTSDVIIYNYTPHLLDFSIEPTLYICLNVVWETVSPKKIVRMLVLPLELFPDDLQCTLTTPVIYIYI